jgi:holin-like protein
MLRVLKVIAQIGLLSLFVWLGGRFAALTGLPLPGSVVGLVFLYLALRSGLVKLAFIQEGADFLLRHLVFFFIPAAVDLMNWGGVFYRYGFRLALAIAGSTFLTFVVSGHVSQWLRRRHQPCES